MDISTYKKHRPRGFSNAWKNPSFYIINRNWFPQVWQQTIKYKRACFLHFPEAYSLFLSVLDFSRTGVLIDQAAAWFYHGDCLIDQMAAWFWSGSNLTNQARPDFNQAPAWPIWQPPDFHIFRFSTVKHVVIQPIRRLLRWKRGLEVYTIILLT